MVVACHKKHTKPCYLSTATMDDFIHTIEDDDNVRETNKTMVDTILRRVVLVCCRMRMSSG